MKRPTALLISVFLATSAITISTAAFAQTPATHPPPVVSSTAYGNLPLSFEVNQGQTDPSVQFLVHGQGYTLFLHPGEALLALQPANARSVSHVVQIKLDGANLKAEATPEDKQITRTNYFLGSNPTQWRTDIPNYSRIRYRSIYDGIDLVYYGNQRRLEHDFVIAPHADPGKIILALSGAENPHIDPATGDLILSASTGENQASLRLLKPITYQESSGHRTEIPTAYKLLANNKFGFEVAAFDHSQPLIIDPVLTYSTYLGGSGSNGMGDQGNGIAVDSAGNAYVVGTTYSTNFPVTTGAFQTTTNAPAGGSTVFVTKLNAAGTALVYSTYLGGSGSASGGDFGYGIALDSANNAYITGATYSTDFPVTCGALQTTNPSTTSDATTGFVARLNATGNALEYSTYLGGTGNNASPAQGDVAQAIAVDPAGDAYVTGYTFSSDFPVTDAAFQTDFKGSATSSNAFAAKLDPLGTALLYSTFLGGSGGDYGNAIAIDASGDVYVTGSTGSSNFPVKDGAFQPALGGSSNAFVTELNPTGEDEVYSTYLGGNGGDSAQAIAIDKNGFTYVAGNTSSSNFPLTAGVLEGTNSGIGGLLGVNGVGPSLGVTGTGAFVTKLSAGGSALEYSTYLEGAGTSVAGLAVDSTGTAYITGSAAAPLSYSYYSGFQPTPDALSEPGGPLSAFVVKLSPSATALNYATLLGGSASDRATALALDGAGNVYLTGVANSTDFPTTAGAFETTFGTPPGSLIPTTLSIVSQQFDCSVQFPGYSVFVDLMVNSDSNGPAPTGSVYFTGGFEVGEAAMPVTPSSDGTSLVDLIGTSSSEVAQSAGWTAVYSGDSIYAGSSLSGTTTGPGNCDSQPYVSRPGSKSDLPQSRLSLPAQQGNSQSKFATRYPRPANLPVTAEALPKANNTASISGSNAFISKFALAAEANQTLYSGISSAGLPTSLSISYESIVPGLAWALHVDLTLNSSTPGPPPTGTVTLLTFGLLLLSPGPGIVSAQVAGSSTGVSTVPDLWIYNLNGPGPLAWTAQYSGDSNYQSSVISGIAPNPPCYPDCYTWKPVLKPLHSTSASAVEARANSASSTPAKLSIPEPKFIPPPAIQQGDRQESQARRSAESPTTFACVAPGGAVTPAFSLAAGTYTSVQTVTITDTTAGAAIYYTLNGTTPTNKSILYTGPIQVRGSATLQAIAYAPGVLPSSVASATYTLDAAAPVFNPPSGAYPGPLTVTITSATPTAEIAYTPNSSNPTVYSVYIGPFTITASGKFYALAQETGFTRSPVTEAAYTIEPAAATPVFSLPTGNYLNARIVTITDTTPGVIIYYTTNGTTPATSSTVYTGPITVASTETLEAIAVAADYTSSAVASATYTIQLSTTSELQFVAIPPCRIADTRNPAGAFGGPELAAAASRTFNIPQSACGIPTTATAYSLNVTVVPDQALGYLTLWAAGQPQPIVSTLNSDGRVKANAAITPAGANGGVSVYASNATQFILDIDGYFVPAGASTAGLQFFPLTPCRVADTRNAAGALGGPFLAANTSRDFPVQSSFCGIPATVAAYSLNVTAVPHGPLSYLTAWASGQPQPLASTLNASTGAVTANAAIVSAGSSGAVSIFVSDATDVILDVNGYFAPPATGGLSLYTVTPCRVLDTRSSSGAFDGVLAVPVQASSCAPSATAQAYILNATVVPSGELSYLTLWAAGAQQPDVSTLNADDGAIMSNMAIVSATNGSIDAFSTDPTQLILDLSGYFAP